jgi:O-antigen ligase
MEASHNVPSASTKLPRIALGEQLPWGTALLSLFLAFVACQKLSAAGPSSTEGNVGFTFFLVACAAAAISLFPKGAFRAFLGLYLALEVLCVSSIVGYRTVTYVSLLFAALLARRLSKAHKWTIELPGTSWLLCLAVVVFAQFFRSASMRDAFPVVCDAFAFTLVLWKLPGIARADIRKAASTFIIGTCGAGLAIFIASPLTMSRLGFDLGFNPNELGNLVGATLMLLASGFFIRREHFSFWWITLTLAVLLLLTGSRTSIYACFGGILLFMILRKRRRIATYMALAAITLALIGYTKQSDDDPFSLTGRVASPISQSFDESSAQRATIWAFLLSQVGTYWKWGAWLTNVSQVADAAGMPVMDPSNKTFIGYQTHNLYLTILLELGILGLILLLVWQFKFLYWGFRRPYGNALLVPMMLYMIIQGFFQGSNLNFLTAFLLVVAYRVQSVPEPHLSGKLQPGLGAAKGCA